MDWVDKTELTDWITDRARQIGFSSVGIAPAVAASGTRHLDQWLEAGYAGTMRYLADRRDAYAHPTSVLEGVQSLVMLTVDYRTAPPAPTAAGQGRVSRYAWGDEDYHDIIHAWLKQLAGDLRAEVPAARVRGVVDTAPLLEREFAQLAGLGWIGKHTLLLNRQQGSWFFLAALLTDLPLDFNAQPATDHCGTCTACLDVCPTGAFPQPHVLDASRCISYLTIEHRDAIPHELRAGIGEWVFGCDLCQDVCPWNNKSPHAAEPRFAPRDDLNPLDLVELLAMDDEAFRQRFRRTPLWRPKRRGLLRNAAIALGNRPNPAALPALAAALADAEPLVRGAAAWALGRYGSPGREALLRRQSLEKDTEVLAEIAHSLGSEPVDHLANDTKK